MANQTQAAYLRDIVQLTDTLVIKCTADALALNQSYRDYHQVDFSETPEAQWPYYLHLAGKYVKGYDTPMTVISQDTREEIAFTYENLQIHLATKKAYWIGSPDYRELLSRYPLQDGLIRGIINPTPPEVALAAKDWSILNWDTSLVEPQETNLIPELQRRIDAMTLNYWHARWTLTNELYAAGYVAQLIFAIPREIQNIRLMNCGSRYVHSYHLWGLLGSYGRLDRWRNYLTNDQAMWLYRNIAVLFNNVGKTSTFQALLENILTVRGIPLTHQEIQHDVGSMPDEIYPTPQVAKIPLNVYAEAPTGIVTTSIENVLTSEQPLALENSKYLANELYNVPIAARSAFVNQLPTKVLESSMTDLTDDIPVKLTNTVYNTWVWAVADGRYTADVSFIDPTTSTVMRVTAAEALILWVYLTARTYGAELVNIPTLMTRGVMRPLIPSYDELRAAMPERYISRTDILVALSHYEAPGQIVSTEAFQQYCRRVNNAVQAHRMQVAYVEDPMRRGFMESLCSRMYQSMRVTLPGNYANYDAFLRSIRLDVSTMLQGSFEAFAESVYVAATGMDLRDVTSMQEVQAAMVGIMQQLSSRTVQYIAHINSDPLLTPNNIASRFGITGESDVSRERIEQAQRFSRNGEKDYLAIEPGRAPFLGAGQIGVTESESMTVGRTMGFRQVGAAQSYHRVLISQARFSVIAGPTIQEQVDQPNLNGISLYEFTDPVITSTLVNPNLPSGETEIF